jgi:hypothetical protein
MHRELLSIDTIRSHDQLVLQVGVVALVVIVVVVVAVVAIFVA